MSTATINAPGVTTIDPGATYSDHGVAVLFGISERQLRQWRKKRRGGHLWFPRPFLRGRTPCWTGRTLIAWQERLQEEVSC